MAEKVEPPSPTPIPSFLEVKCTSSGDTRRFAIGTEAGFAVSVINRKLSSKPDSPMALLIESSKENEEPITFGPNSVLLNYGEGWVLQTVNLHHFTGVVDGEDPVRPMRYRSSVADSSEGQRGTKPVALGVGYIGKIILAFVLLFMLGTALTLALENLPMLLSFLYDPK